MQHVYVIVVSAFLCGSRWLLEGDRVLLEVSRAEDLAKRGKVKIDGHAEDGPLPSGPPERNKRSKQQISPDDPPLKSSKAPSGPVSTPLEEVGIAGKTADLLRAASIDTAESLRAAVAVDDPVATLVALPGIGQKTAESILAILQGAG